ncbi:MAG: GNAT family N-acetyltransferase, partial [Pseudomonadales bacterium]|nr:GNAT family N-acetyltransferase [Pseudomonadales bacterium]
GISPSEQNKLKPGLVFHSLCINHALSSGKNAYDFLGGEAQYKQSLANTTEDLAMVALQKPTLKLYAEQKGRYIKHRVQRILSPKGTTSVQNSQ